MAQKRDLALVNARVRTVDAQDTVADALLMRNGRIAAVGSEAEVRRAAGRIARSGTWPGPPWSRASSMRTIT
jgi:predicted amidohydrolase YtcJ